MIGERYDRLMVLHRVFMILPFVFFILFVLFVVLFFFFPFCAFKKAAEKKLRILVVSIEFQRLRDFAMEDIRGLSVN